MTGSNPDRPPDAAFLDEQVLKARIGIHQTLGELRTALARTVTPSVITRYHPFGAVVTAGAAAAVVTRKVTSAPRERRPRGPLAVIFRGLRKIVTSALIAQVGALARPVEESPEPCAQPVNEDCGD